MNAFFTSQERALHLVYNDSVSSFTELLQGDNSFTIHHQNIQKIVIKIYKVKDFKAPEIMTELFSQVNLSCNLRKDIKFRSCNVKRVPDDTATPYLGPKTWNLVLPEIKSSERIEIFRKKNKKRKPNRFLCRLYKTFIKNLGFINID